MRHDAGSGTAATRRHRKPRAVGLSPGFVWTIPLTIVVATMAMAGDRMSWIPMTWISRIELVLTLPIVFWAGRPFFERAVQSVIHFSPNMWALIGLGSSAAFLYSAVATLVPAVFPTSLKLMGHVSVYYEAAAVIISLTLLGQMLELRARSKTSAAIRSLLSLAPKTARRINAEGNEADVALTDVRIGDQLRLRPGEIVHR